MVKVFGFLRKSSELKAKNDVIPVVAVPSFKNELEFYENWLKSDAAIDWDKKTSNDSDKLATKIQAIMNNADKSDDAKCDDINLLVLNAQLDRQISFNKKNNQIIFSKKDNHLQLCNLTRFSPNMVEAILIKCKSLEQIEQMSICDGEVKQFANMTSFTNLKKLHLSNNKLETPPSPDTLPTGLKYLNLDRNQVNCKNPPKYPKELKVHYPEQNKAASKKKKNN